MKKLLTSLLILPLFAVAQMSLYTLDEFGNRNYILRQSESLKPDTLKLGVPLPNIYLPHWTLQDTLSPIYVDQNGYIKLRPNYIYKVDSTIYNIISKDTTVLNVIPKDTVVLNVIPKDTTILRIAYKDTTIIRVNYKDTCYTAPVDTTDQGGGTTNPPPVEPPPVNSTRYNFVMTQATSSRPWLMPFGGSEQWNDQNFAASNVRKLDKYFRFSWSMLENGQGQYNWTRFDQEINDAISKGQKFSFGIMTHYPDAVSPHRLNYDGGYSVYPLYLHNLMQAESVKDWRAGNGSWVPNWNSEAYITRLLALHKALDAHIKSTSFNGVAYKDVINYIDIRGYGAFGEWHSYTIADQMSQYPAGTRATLASLKRIVDAHVQGFPDFPLVALVAAFDCNRFGNTMNPPEIAYYVLNARNNWGLIGYRRDNWGDEAAYYDDISIKNNNTVNGMNIGATIRERYRYAPIVGEPCCSQTSYSTLANQVRNHRAVSIGNGNYANNSINQQNYLAAASIAGHRVTIESGYFQGGTVVVNWKNTGLTPVYEDYDTYFELRDASGSVVRRLKSGSSIKLKLPGTWTTTDTFSGLPAGSYDLHVVVQNNFRSYPIAITTSKVATVKL